MCTIPMTHTLTKVNQDRAGRMLLSRYCARDPTCAERLRFDPEGFAVNVFDKLDSGKLPCATALKLKRTELQTLLNELVSGHWPTMRLPMAPAFLYRLDRCEDEDLVALNRSVSAARLRSTAGIPMPVGGSIIQELNVEYACDIDGSSTFVFLFTRGHLMGCTISVLPFSVASYLMHADVRLHIPTTCNDDSS